MPLSVLKIGGKARFVRMIQKSEDLPEYDTLFITWQCVDTAVIVRIEKGYPLIEIFISIRGFFFGLMALLK